MIPKVLVPPQQKIPLAHSANSVVIETRFDILLQTGNDFTDIPALRCKGEMPSPDLIIKPKTLLK
ncbi:hypothetical protein ACFLTU_07075 [Bacteroidota bacterium]